MIKINGVELPEYPESFSVTTLDIDDGDTTSRAADGTLHRDRIATKRQIEMSWGPLDWSNTSVILQSMKDVFFDVYYPDPMIGTYVTKTFYAGDRPTTFAIQDGNTIKWSGLKFSLTEK